MALSGIPFRQDPLKFGVACKKQEKKNKQIIWIEGLEVFVGIACN